MLGSREIMIEKSGYTIKFRVLFGMTGHNGSRNYWRPVIGRKCRRFAKGSPLNRADFEICKAN